MKDHQLGTFLRTHSSLTPEKGFFSVSTKHYKECLGLRKAFPNIQIHEIDICNNNPSLE